MIQICTFIQEITQIQQNNFYRTQVNHKQKYPYLLANFVYFLQNVDHEIRALFSPDIKFRP